VKRVSEQPAANVVVIGGSAGAIGALSRLVAGFTPDLAAAIFVVIHIPPDVRSVLPEILSRAGPLPAQHAREGESVRMGRIYVAPPNRHLTVQNSTMRVQMGPRENRHRPAIDPLFRTAARAYPGCVIGVILSGYLDDGVAGLYAVRRQGGVAMIQEPADAEAADMPLRAMEYSGADYVLPAAEIGQVIPRLLQCVGGVMGKSNADKENGARANEDQRTNEQVAYPEEGGGKPSVFACPECHGTLWELQEGKVTRFRCRVGHAYSEGALHQELSESAESALWAAMRALEEKAAMNGRIADTSAAPPSHRDRLRDQAAADQQHAQVIRNMIFQGK